MEVKEPSAQYLSSREQQLTEIGPLPADWSVSTVGDEFHVQLGKMLDTEKNVGTPKPFLGNRAVQWGRIDVTDVGEIRLSTSELQRYRLVDGDLLVCEGGEVGRSAIWRDQLEECYYQKALHRLRAKRGYSQEFMAAVLEQFARGGMLQNYVTQTSIAHLPKEKFVALPIPKPSTADEQRGISQAVGDADALISSLEQLLTKKRQIKQGAMQELLTGKRRLPGFQGNWGEATFADVAFIDPENLSSGTPAGFSFNYIALEGVNQGRLDSFAELQFENAPSRARRVLRDGDVLVSTVRPNLKSHLLLDTLLGNWIASTGFSVVRCKPNIACPGFLFALLFSEVVEQQIDTLLTGSNYPAINGRDVANLAFTCPPFDEQVAIARALSDMDEEISALESRLTKVRALKQAMAQALLTGRIRLVEPNL
ncbi:restriction endonuclease subunit S [Leptospira sp. 96542]|nr:restriction endonuclease subunit S [Leptospira sp. 96542]